MWVWRVRLVDSWERRWYCLEGEWRWRMKQTKPMRTVSWLEGLGFTRWWVLDVGQSERNSVEVVKWISRYWQRIHSPANDFRLLLTLVYYWLSSTTGLSMWCLSWPTIVHFFCLCFSELSERSSGTLLLLVLLESSSRTSSEGSLQQISTYPEKCSLPYKWLCSMGSRYAWICFGLWFCFCSYLYSEHVVCGSQSTAVLVQIAATYTETVYSDVSFSIHKSWLPVDFHSQFLKTAELYFVPWDLWTHSVLCQTNWFWFRLSDFFVCLTHTFW